MASGPLRLAAVDEDQKPLLDAFRAAHPEVLIGGGEFGTWQAIIPEENGETTIVRYTLRELLGKLDALLGTERKGSCSCSCAACNEAGAWLSGHCGNKNSCCNM